MSEPDVLSEPTAGRRAIQGGSIRVAGYAVGTALTAATSMLLLRYLSVEDFGAYVTVTSLVAIVGGLTEAGLGIVVQREWIAAPTDSDRREIVASLVGMRLAATPLGVVVAVVFGSVAGYDGAMLAGIALGGAGLVVSNVAASLTVPLTARLRLGAVTAAELARQAAIMAVIVIVVVAGGSLAALFLAHVAGGLAMLVTVVAVLGGYAVARPAFRWERWRPLLVAAAPVAAAVVVNVVYLRLLVLLMSILGDPVETGLFATSYRVLEVFAVVPGLMMSAAFPILARAGADDDARLAYALQRMVEVGLLTAWLLVLVLVIASEPIVVVLGGDRYRDAAGVLEVQAFALVGAFLTQVWALGLVAVHRQSALVVVNGAALVTGLGLGCVAIPLAGEHGAAAVAVIGEMVLAGTAAIVLTRSLPSLRPRAGRPLRIFAAAGVALAVGRLSGLPDVVAAVVSAAAFLAMAWRLGAVPSELLDALPRRSQSAS